MHRDIVTLSEILVKKSGCEEGGMLGLLTAQKRWAAECARYLKMKLEGERMGEGEANGDGDRDRGVKIKVFAWDDSDQDESGGEGSSQIETSARMGTVRWEKGEVHLVMYPEKLKGHAKDFWQHTGWGISSRYAQTLLARVVDLKPQKARPESVSGSCMKGKVRTQRNNDEKVVQSTRLANETETRAEAILRERISRLASSSDHQTVVPCNIFLYPTGMTAIASIAHVIKSLSHHQRLPSPVKSQDAHPTIIIYGFLYLDTFKLLSKIFGFHLHLLGHSSAAELDSLATCLRSGSLTNVLALFAEFPGNPLLRTPDLARIRLLADEYGFMVVCDDTVGTLVNVDILAQVDVLVTSLTKIFSGACDVMGGSLILNPDSRWHGDVRRELRGVESSEGTSWYPHDAEVMERNSRDFAGRMREINANARRVYEMMAVAGKEMGVVREVFYPLGSDTQQLYERHARHIASPTSSSSEEKGVSTSAPAAAACGLPSHHEHPSMEYGYGYLLSLTFNHPGQAVAFYDALDVAKGPSLGTNFTLACAYTLFAHYGEREWAAGYGVEEFLVRVSVGMEEWGGEEGGLRGKFERALNTAEAVGG